METVFHFGQDSDRFLHDFEEKRADRVLQEIADRPMEELKAILCSLREDHRTFAAKGA